MFFLFLTRCLSLSLLCLLLSLSDSFSLTHLGSDQAWGGSTVAAGHHGRPEKLHRSTLQYGPPLSAEGLLRVMIMVIYLVGSFGPVPPVNTAIHTLGRDLTEAVGIVRPAVTMVGPRPRTQPPLARPAAHGERPAIIKSAGRLGGHQGREHHVPPANALGDGCLSLVRMLAKPPAALSPLISLSLSLSLSPSSRVSVCVYP